MIPWAILYGITVYYAFKADKIKKDNDISTYKEIVAFTEGRQLDEIEQQREIGKTPVSNGYLYDRKWGNCICCGLFNGTIIFFVKFQFKNSL